MPAPCPATEPVTLRRCLLCSLGWTALCVLLAGAAWCVCDPNRNGRIGWLDGLRVLLLALTQTAAVLLLTNRAFAGLEQLQQQTKRAHAWWQMAVVGAWRAVLNAVLMVMTAADVFVLLLLMFVAFEEATPLCRLD